MRRKPNYRRVESIAYEMLSTLKEPALPIDIFKLANSYPDLRVKTYTWFANKRKCSFEYVINSVAESDSGCCFLNRDKAQYLILYNDRIESEGHKRWTIAHELGHYLLKHNEESDRTIVSRNTLSKSEYQVFEKEANCFARSVLAPPHLIVALEIANPAETGYVFDLSQKASHSVISFFEESKRMGIKYAGKGTLIDNFMNVIYRFKQLQCCTNCGFECHRQNTFCQICGGEHFKRAGGASNMIYPGVDLTENFGAKVCPNCENEEHNENAVFCMICGISRFNHCLNADESDGDRCQNFDRLPANARYCPDCGKPSSFYTMKALPAWIDSLLPF